MNKHQKTIRFLRIIGFIEGVSYLVLLLISMPLKYLLKLPKPVLINGWIHGFLFIVLVVAILVTWVVRKWPFKRAFIAGLVSFIPLGTFWFDKSLKIEEENCASK